ncbi:MAG: TetR/AcrR family transcriptional regulator [Acidimicrobiales bacterium]
MTSTAAPAVPDELDPRRLQILRAALDVIADRGYADTRIADVAVRVGVSPALVMYYFKSKDRLLAETLRYAEDVWYADGTRRLEAIPTAAGRLEELVRITCLSGEDVGLSESWSLWIDLWSQALRRPQVAAVREQFDEHWRETISAVVRDGQAAGEFDAVDADDAAIALSALLDGLSVQIALRDRVVTEDRAFRTAMQFAAQLLGFRWDPPGRSRRRP